MTTEPRTLTVAQLRGLIALAELHGADSVTLGSTDDDGSTFAYATHAGQESGGWVGVAGELEP